MTDSTPNAQPKLGILAGGGKLPVELIKHCIASERPFHVITFTGQPTPDMRLPRKQHSKCGLLQVKKIIEQLRLYGVTEVVLAGNIRKPKLWHLIPDGAGAKLLRQAKSRHDDELLRLALDYMAEQGFTIASPQAIKPELLAPVGLLTKSKPTQEELVDIELGVMAARALGRQDIGQACIVANNTVIGVEGVEGTDGLIARCAPYRARKRKAQGGALVKMAKPQQTDAADLPTIGEHTLRVLKHYKYRGIALSAEKSLIIDRPAVVKLANKFGMFIVALTDEQTQPDVKVKVKKKAAKKPKEKSKNKKENSKKDNKSEVKNEPEKAAAPEPVVPEKSVEPEPITPPETDKTQVADVKSLDAPDDKPQLSTKPKPA